MPAFAVTTAKGPNWDHTRTIREQPFWDDLAVEAPDEHALRSVFDADPWIVHQVFRIKHVRAWTLWLDGRSRRPPPG